MAGWRGSLSRRCQRAPWGSWSWVTLVSGSIIAEVCDPQHVAGIDVARVARVAGDSVRWVADPVVVVGDRHHGVEPVAADGDLPGAVRGVLDRGQHEAAACGYRPPRRSGRAGRARRRVRLR